MDSHHDGTAGGASQPGSARGQRLALIDTVERDGRHGRVLDVHAWPLVLGRGLDCDIVLDDPHVAERHARIAPDAEGRLLLTVLDTVNGVELEGRRLGAGSSAALPPQGASLVLGQTRLRLRLAGAPVAAELPLPRAGRSPLWLGLPLYALLLLDQAIGLDPGAEISDWLAGALGLPAALVAWCALWALLSKLFQHRFDFAGHLRIALPWLLGMQLASMLVPPLAAALDAPWLWQATGPLRLLLTLLWLHAHAVHVLPQHRRAVLAALAVMAVVGGGLSLQATWRAHDSLVAKPYMSTLPVPGLRLGTAEPPAALVEGMGDLGPPLAQRAATARARGQAHGADGPDDE